MIIQIGTEVDESRILWKRKESDEWKRADIDDLIEAYENRQKDPKPGDSISRQALIDEALEDGNGAVLSYTKGMDEDELVEHIEKQMIEHFIGVIKYAPPVEPELVSGDTTSKEALIQSFLADCECKDRSEAKAVTCSLDTMLELIDDAPPVEPKRTKGEWVRTKNPIGETIVVCSNCGKIRQQGYDNFCGYCGADMKGADGHERAIEQMEHDMRYEPTYNPEDGSM